MAWALPGFGVTKGGVQRFADAVEPVVVVVAFGVGAGFGFTYTEYVIPDRPRSAAASVDAAMYDWASSTAEAYSDSGASSDACASGASTPSGAMYAAANAATATEAKTLTTPRRRDQRAWGVWGRRAATVDARVSSVPGEEGVSSLPEVTMPRF